MLKNFLHQLFPSRVRGAKAEEPPDAALQHAIKEFNASNLAGAYAIAEPIVRCDPQYHAAWNLLGAVELGWGNNEAATRHFERAIAVQPGSAPYLSNCGEAFRRAGRIDDAVEYCRAAVEADPRDAPAHHNLALALTAMGEVEGAYVAFQSALTIRPDFMSARSGFLFLLCHHPGIDAANVLAEHRRWDELHARALVPMPAPRALRADSERPIRVGYVSGDFWRHALSYFIEPLLTHHDPASFEVFCYHNSRKADEVTERLRACVSHWRDIAGMTDEAVAQQVSRDGIDILVDLAGHTAGNRLGVFARKPAPVQVSYVGYLNTTGLHSMDFRITDAYADPPATSDALYTERLVRMPHSQWCYRPPSDTPEVNALPALKRGTVTYGSLHNLAKINRSVIELWARLLLRHPNSELLIGGIPAEAVRRRLREQFSESGIDSARLQLIGKCSFDDYWRLYHRIDISLDAFPYNGATTTCESLWMGVPVVTLAGSHAAARSGVSLLSTAGLPELIADSPQRYVDIAVELARDMQRLTGLRATLRATMQRSPLMDEAGHARAFERLLYGMVGEETRTRT